MGKMIGVLAVEHIAVGLVENQKLVGSVRVYPEAETDDDYIQELAAEDIAQRIRQQIELVAQGVEVEAIGIGVPGVIRDGIVEESPNLAQIKGFPLGPALAALLERPVEQVRILNDADAFAAGLAATRGHLDKLIRVWTLGSGIGFGRYPSTDGIWEGGHSVVTLDPKENFCRCGGVGHLEGIMGNRAMRFRFLDMEPDEVFEAATAGDARCRDFVKMWHRALAAATATSIHMDGCGKFFISGPNARYIDIGLLYMYVHEMVKMTPLQGSNLEVISTTDETAIIGAAVTASGRAN